MFRKIERDEEKIEWFMGLIKSRMVPKFNKDRVLNTKRENSSPLKPPVFDFEKSPWPPIFEF